MNVNIREYMTAYVYMVDRDDGLKYVGITVNPSRRKSEHIKSDRFKGKFVKFTILETCDTYDEAEDLEEYYIAKFDTYNNGLNMTVDGKGTNKDTKFNTLGRKFSDKSKEKMSANHHSKQPGYINPLKGKKHSAETRAKWSKLRKGKIWKGNPMFTYESADNIRSLYKNKTILIPTGMILQNIKKSQRENYMNISSDLWKTKSGAVLSYRLLLSKLIADRFNCTYNHILNIIDNKSYVK